MMTIEQVEAARQQLLAAGTPKPEIIRQLAADCIGWPYVFGAWGARCVPSARGARMSADHPTIQSKCRVLSGPYDWRNIRDNSKCGACQWSIGCRMYDCRGFTRWLLQQVGLDITGAGCTSQYNTAANWTARGKIKDMPDVVCCVFKYSSSTGRYEHTGMHLGGGAIIHCSGNVQRGKTTDRGWTHYAIPKGLYDGGEEIPVITKPTLRKGSKGDLVAELQQKLTDLGFPCGAIDGIYGTKTYNAVVLYQTEAKLDPDGVCGPKTWAALDGATPPEPVQTYRVTIEGVTWDQYRRILEICPLAEADKEA